MDESSQSDITQILHDWNSGDEGAHERLLPYVYDELKRQARRLMSRAPKSSWYACRKRAWAWP